MIEFSQDLSKKLYGKNAIVQRVCTRIAHTTADIPYYEKGIDIFEFTYGSQSAAIRLGLRDFGVNVQTSSDNSRIKVYDVIIDTEKEGVQ